jgi:hypothetical protein
MALDTNIALGVKPIEQPNMLAQMGQMMQLRQAQQGYESENALRDFYAQGGDLSTAEGRRQLMSRAPMQGQKLIGQQSEIAARDIGTAEKSLELYKNQVGFIKSPEDAARWLSNFYANPTTRPYVESVAPMDVALAAIPKNDPAAFQAWLRNASLKAEKLFVDANTEATNRTRIQAANIGAGPGNRQATIAEQNFAIAQADRAEADRLAGRPPSAAPAALPIGGGGGGGGGAPFALPMTGGSAAPAVTNALPAIVGAAPAAPASTNMLVPGAQAPATTPVTPVAPAVAPTVAPATATAPASDPNTRIQAISAEIERLRPYMGNPKVALNVQQLATERTQLIAAAKQEAPTLTRIDDPTTLGQRLEINAREYRGGGLGSPGVLGVARTDKLTPQQTVKLKAEIGKDFKAVERTIAETDALLESIDAVRNSNLERVAGPIDARTFTMTNEGKLAETRFENLKGKVTAIAKTAATMTGAIGSIANQEWQILANQIAVLDLKNGKEPSLEQIDQLERQAMSIANRMRDGFSRQYGEYLDELGPQYREIPNVTYTPGSAGYTPTGKKTPAKPRATPASTGNITDNADVAKVVEFGSLK